MRSVKYIIALIKGDACFTPLKNESVDCVVTSPPYWILRKYDVDCKRLWEGGDDYEAWYGQLGLEPSLSLYIKHLLCCFKEVWRVLKPSGTLWLNIGDSYSGSGKGDGGRGSKQKTNRGSRFELKSTACIGGLKSKNLIGIPWTLAFALRDAGWYLRSDIIWYKPNVMPESVRDRPTRSHEYLFLFGKSRKYYYNVEAVKESAVTAGCKKRNKRSVWTIPNQTYKGAHYATFPVNLVKLCISAGCPPEGTVLDPFCGSGTVGLAARELGRSCILIDRAYQDLAKRRLA